MFRVYSTSVGWKGGGGRLGVEREDKHARGDLSLRLALGKGGGVGLGAGVGVQLWYPRQVDGRSVADPVRNRRVERGRLPLTFLPVNALSLSLPPTVKGDK